MKYEVAGRRKDPIDPSLRKLITALMTNALKDLSGEGVVLINYGKKSKKTRKDFQREYQMNALEWILAKEWPDNLLSFQYACEVLNLDEEATRREMLKIASEGNTKHFRTHYSRS